LGGEVRTSNCNK